MAIVDSLLKLVRVRGADALVLQTGAVPHLERAGERVALTMPLPSDDVFAMMLREVTGDGNLLEKTHYDSGGDTFGVAIDRMGAGYRMVLSLGDQVRSANAAPARSAPEELAVVGVHSTEVIERMLQAAEVESASDVIVSTSSPPRMRVGGDLQMLAGEPTSEEALMSALALSEKQQSELAETGSCDLAFTRADHRYRVNLFCQHGGLAAAFRPIRNSALQLDELNLPSDFPELTRFRSGLVLFVGTAGSGKSTTLAALVEHLNRTATKHIITVEDPIEYEYTPHSCLIHQREVGRHVRDFQSGLRAALRESPDVILLGEMRDRETIAAALTAAETGHLVLSTLHSASSGMAIHRIVDVFPEHQQKQVLLQLSDVLRAVVTQQLLVSTRPPLRVPAIEKLMVTHAVSNKIRDNRCHQIETELQRGRAEGMVTLEASLARLVKRRLIDSRVARRVARDCEVLEQLAR